MANPSGLPAADRRGPLQAEGKRSAGGRATYLVIRPQADSAVSAVEVDARPDHGRRTVRLQRGGSSSPASNVTESSANHGSGTNHRSTIRVRITSTAAAPRHPIRPPWKP